MANALVRDAALQAAPTSKRGILERVFARMFEGLVYAQIWEDPEVDMAALELGPTSRLVTIASGGCNVMSYLTADPMDVQAVDLNPAHVALLEAQAHRRPPSAALRGVPRLLRRGRHRQQSATLRAVRGPAPGARGARLLGQARPRRPPPDLDVQPQPLQPRPARPHHPARARGLPAARQAAPAHARRAQHGRAAPAVRGRAGAGVRQQVRAQAGRPAGGLFRPGHPARPVRRAQGRCRRQPRHAAAQPGRAPRLRLPDPGELVRLAGLRPALSRPGPGPAALPAAGELRRAARAGRRGSRSSRSPSPTSCAGRMRGPSMPMSCSTPRTG